MTTPKQTVIHRHVRPEQFRPGVYRHYKGGLYHAIALGWMNEVSTPHMLGVIYLSMTTGEWHVRPYTSLILDAWCDEVLAPYTDVPEGHTAEVWVPRFIYVGPQKIIT